MQILPKNWVTNYPHDGIVHSVYGEEVATYIEIMLEDWAQSDEEAYLHGCYMLWSNECIMRAFGESSAHLGQTPHEIITEYAKYNYQHGARFYKL